MRKIVSVLIVICSICAGSISVFGEEKNDNTINLETPTSYEDVLKYIKLRGYDTTIEARTYKANYQGTNDMNGNSFSYRVTVYVDYEVEVSPDGRRLSKVTSIDSQEDVIQPWLEYSHRDGWVDKMTANNAIISGRGRYASKEGMLFNYDVIFKVSFDKFGKPL